MMLAEISTIDSNKIKISIRPASSRSSTPGIMSDDNTNLTKGGITVTKPYLPSLQRDQDANRELNKAGNLAPTKELLLYAEELTRASYSSDTHDDSNASSSCSFLSNELSAKFKRPKGSKHAHKNQPFVVHSSCSDGNENGTTKSRPTAMKVELSAPQTSKCTNKTVEKIKTKLSLEDRAKEVLKNGGMSTDIKVLLEEIKKLDSTRVLFPKTLDANRALFPMKLYDLLNHENTNPLIMTWAHHGKSFLIVDIDKFTEAILPRVFNQTSFASFQRQLNLYGFKRVAKSSPPAERAYFHEMFSRDSAQSCMRIRRHKTKSAAEKASTASDSDAASASEMVHTSDKHGKEVKVDKKPFNKRKFVEKMDAASNKITESNEESDAESKKLKIPGIEDSATIDRIGASNKYETVDSYTQWLAALSQDALIYSSKPQVPNINDRISAISHLLAPPLPNHYAPSPANLIQFQQNRGQLFGNLGLSMQQPMLPNNANLLNPLNHVALSASNINFMKNLLNANNRNNQDRYNQR